MKAALLLVLAVAIVGSFATEEVASFAGDRILRLSLNENTITPIQHAAYFNLRQWGFDWWNDNDVRVPAVQYGRVVEFLANAQIPFITLIEDVQKLVDAERAHIEATLQAEANGVAPTIFGRNGAPVPTFFNDYRKLADIWTFVDQLVSQYPSLAKKVQIGTSYQNRSLNVIVISSGKGAKNSIYLEGGIHSREWVAHTTVLFLAWSLLSGYGTDKNVTTLVDTFDFHINPVVNPDGYEFSWTNNRMWRKTRKPNAGSVCIGTDPNRNWDDHWCEQGADRDPCSDAYCGSAAFSEREVKAVADYNLKVGNVKGFIDFHSYSQLWMQPFGWTSKLPADAQDQTNAGQAAVKAIKQTHGKTYKEGSIYTIIYPASGSSADWGYDTAKVKYPYGVELRDTGEHGFILPANQIVPTGEEILQAVNAWATYIAAH